MEEAEAAFTCTWDIAAFSAFAIYTGENRLVRVLGTGSCPQDGFSVGLIRFTGNIGIVPEPNRLHLSLVELAPPVGPTVIAEEKIDDFFDVSQAVNEVVIRGLGSVPVTEPDTGDGSAPD
jgi:hypothetical protein